MKRCRSRMHLLAAVTLAGGAAVLLAGCNQDPGPNRAPTASDMQADKSKMTPEQQKMMQDGMKRMGSPPKGAPQ